MKPRAEPEVAVRNEQTQVPVDVEALRSWARRVLLAQACDFGVSLAILDDEQIRRFNRDFLGHDRPTDCLSFPLLAAEDQEPLLGEVLVSGETAAREAAARGRTVEAELALYVVHGLLHLLGYDDQEQADEQAMQARERELLADLGFPGR